MFFTLIFRKHLMIPWQSGWVNLTSQKKQVLVDGIKSIILDVTSRAMQGSVLEPLLFLIYINLMVEKVYEDEFYLFVEKLKVYNEI